jgi:regulator of sigma E protease
MLSSVFNYFADAPIWVWLMVPAFPFVLTIIVFFHELGHFLVARWCGVKVVTFSIGFGRELIGFTDRQGTRWKLAPIPLGGYVKFLGDDNAASVPDPAAVAKLPPEDREAAFISKPVGRRAAIVAAGPIANFILAIAIYTAVFAISGRSEISARVDRVTPGSAAEAAGLQQGDMILAVDGSKIAGFTALRRAVAAKPDGPLALLIQRGGQQLTLSLTPKVTEMRDRFGNVTREPILGIAREGGQADVTTTYFTPIEAVGEAFKEVGFLLDATFGYMWRLVAGRASPDQLGGVISVAKMSGQIATLGLVPLINLAAILSVSIGFLNLLPIPILDGGHLLFYAIEKLRGRPLSDRAQEIGYRIGFVMVLMLMFYVSYNDILRLPWFQ